MNKSVDVLAVMHSALGDLMAAQVARVDTDTKVPELSASIDAVAELIEADEEYTRSRDAWLASPFTHEEFQATRDAWKRRAAALARVKGA